MKMMSLIHRLRHGHWPRSQRFSWPQRSRIECWECFWNSPVVRDL